LLEAATSIIAEKDDGALVNAEAAWKKNIGVAVIVNIDKNWCAFETYGKRCI